MKRMILTRATGTPEARAAEAEPPTAKIQLPNLVLVRMTAQSATRPIHQRQPMSRTSRNLPAKRYWSGSSPIAVLTPPI